MVMNNLRGSKQLWPILRYCLTIYLRGGGMRKTVLSHSQDNHFFKMDTSNLNGRDAIYYTLTDTDLHCYWAVNSPFTGAGIIRTLALHA